MQDKLSSTLDLANVTLKLTDGTLVNGASTGKIRDNEPQVIQSKTQGGTSLTIARVDGGISIKGNPIGFITGQNVWGTCNMPALNLAMFAELRKRGILKFTDEQWLNIERGKYTIQEIAFAQYIQCDPKRKSEQLAHLQVLYATIIKDWTGHRLHEYAGGGLILTRKMLSLTIYDKELEIFDTKKEYNRKLTGDIEPQLADKLRVEVTLKYNWMQSRHLLHVHKWEAYRDAHGKKSWNTLARNLVIEGMKLFKLDYIIGCTNVLHADFTTGWPNEDKSLYARWRSGDKLSSQECSRLWTHGLWAGISPRRHENLLWQRMFPNINVVDTVNGRTASATREFERFNSLELPTDSLCGSLLPLEDNIRGSGPKRQLRKIEAKLGMT